VDVVNFTTVACRIF